MAILIVCVLYCALVFLLVQRPPWNSIPEEINRKRKKKNRRRKTDEDEVNYNYDYF